MAFLQQVFTFPSMVSGSSQTSSLEIPGVFSTLFLQVPTMTGGFGADTQIFLRGSCDNVTFYRVALANANTSTVGANDFAVASGSTQKIIQIPCLLPRYVLVETTAVATAGVTSNTPFKIIAISNQ